MAEEELTPPQPAEPPQGLSGPPGANRGEQPVNIEEEMRRSYLDYAMSVIIG